MEMITYLEADREKLRQSLLEAGTPDQAEIVVESEIGRLLLLYNENCGSEKERDAALRMMQAAKSMLPILSACGEPKIWERSGLQGGGTGQERRMDVPAWLALVAGAVLCLAAPLAVMAASGGVIAPLVFLKTAPFALIGAGLVFLAGRRPWKGKWGGGKSASRGRSAAGAGGPANGRGSAGPASAAGAARSSFGASNAIGSSTFETPDRLIELRIDPDRIWNCLRAMVMVVDRNMQEFRDRMEAEKRAARTAAEASGGGYTGGAGKREVQLLSDLLELAYSQRMQEPSRGWGDKSAAKVDIQTAEEMIDNICFYLHEREIEAVDYTQEQQREHAEWFERLPASYGKSMTLRPALVQDGRLLRKGLAADAG